MYEIIYAYIVFLIVWSFFKPWKSNWQFFLFYFCILFPVGSMIFEVSSFSKINFKEVLSFSIVSVVLIVMLLKLRTVDDITDFRAWFRNNKIDKNDSSNEFSQKILMPLFILFYLLCGLHIILYGV